MDLRLNRRLRRERRRKLKAIAASGVLSLFLALFVAGTISAQERVTPEATEPPVTEEGAVDERPIDLGNSQEESSEIELLPPELAISKDVDRAAATPGTTLAYAIVLDNSGDGPALDVVLSDTLPVELNFITGSLSATGGLWGIAGNVITWTGDIMNGDQVVLTFDAEIDAATLPMTTIVNTAYAAWNGNSYQDSAETNVTEMVASLTNYLPIVYAAPPPPPPAPILSASRPSYDNVWTVAWTNPGGGVTGYELQESHSPDFADVTTYNPGLDTSVQIQHALGENNEFYYRVRALSNSGAGDWSNIANVIAGYRDGFAADIDGWGIRRTTFIEEIQVFHEVRNGSGLLIMRVEDSWDWGIASPMVRAPSPPYQIEYRSQIANAGNLVSHGMVFGGDWPGDICPDWSSPPGVYQHDLCFNHFYLPNIIFFGPLKMLFERVDYLVWCPNCGGSPMKRLSDDYSVWFETGPLSGADPLGWNTWRYEVRDTGIKLYVNNGLIRQTDDTTYINEPYFGVFGSTDEYSNSTWRYDYVEVRPLDN